MDKSTNQDRDKFRDKLYTVTEKGKRIWVYAKKPSGRHHIARVLTAILLLAFLFIVPFIKVNGHPFFILNIMSREFIIFGIPFGPHDFHLFGLAMITLIVSIFLFTVVYGRIFCGWICPQTIFMEMIFRKIEYLIEGNANKQHILNKSPWTGEKIFKKILKHSVFYLISFIISNFLLSLIIGMDALLDIITDPPSEHLAGLIIMLIFTGAFYWVYTYFREQVCTLVCPYGRLQGVLIDKKTIVIGYDYLRGEPRGIQKKGAAEKKGDCIDCDNCVEVCPTGIDIRNGTQLECVNCTACIDACDEVMDKIKKPRGLVRYASEEEFESGKKSALSARSIAYSIVLVLLISLTAFLLANRSDFELTILRTAGLLSQEQPGDKISNLYDVKIVNKTFDDFSPALKLENIPGELRIIGNDNLRLGPHEVLETKMLVIIPKDELKMLNTPLKISVNSEGKVIDVVNTSFLGIIKKRKKK